MVWLIAHTHFSCLFPFFSFLIRIMDKFYHKICTFARNGLGSLPTAHCPLPTVFRLPSSVIRHLSFLIIHHSSFIINLHMHPLLQCVTGLSMNFFVQMFIIFLLIQSLCLYHYIKNMSN